jgi:hypothetical protein
LAAGKNKCKGPRVRRQKEQLHLLRSILIMSSIFFSKNLYVHWRVYTWTCITHACIEFADTVCVQSCIAGMKEDSRPLWKENRTCSHAASAYETMHMGIN